LLLQAAYLVLEQYPFARFRFIGEGPIKVDLFVLAQRLGIEYAVEFVGWVGTSELPAQLADLDILVNPSLRGWSETFCISNIEGMSMELPLVTYAVGG
jgi:glycosyltransferase involved in cell wall biosynthesis